MAFLKNIITGAVTENLEADGPEYQSLLKTRTTESVYVSGTGGFGLGSGEGFTDVKANTPIWQEIAFEDTAWPDPVGGRTLVSYCGGAAVSGGEETFSLNGPGVNGKVKSVSWVPFAQYEESGATNYRTIQTGHGRLLSGAVTFTAFAKIQLKGAKVIIPAFSEVKLTLEGDEEFKAGGSGLVPENLVTKSTVTGNAVPADPGGLILVTYTRK